MVSCRISASQIQDTACELNTFYSFLLMQASSRMKPIRRRYLTPTVHAGEEHYGDTQLPVYSKPVLFPFKRDAQLCYTHDDWHKFEIICDENGAPANIDTHGCIVRQLSSDNMLRTYGSLLSLDISSHGSRLNRLGSSFQNSSRPSL